MRIVRVAAYRIENSTIQPKKIDIEYDNFVIVVRIHRDKVQIESLVYT